jgi:hypothetical protein
MSTLTRTLAPLALALGLVAATSATAQVAGSYVGTTSQGLSISLTLIDDGAGGLIFTGQTTQWNEACKTGDTKFAWWGVGASDPLTGNTVTVSYRGNALFEDVAMRFNGTHVDGRFSGGEATFVDVNTSTGKTEACHSGRLTFSADLQVAAGARAPHAGLAAGEARALRP